MVLNVKHPIIVSRTSYEEVLMLENVIRGNKGNYEDSLNECNQQSNKNNWQIVMA